MEPPLPDLKLITVKGPRSGETLDFKPGSTIRIGRIKRGNTFSINEDGISSKHLLIESKSGKWTIQDLDSSNGTILNTTDLVPNSPVDLHDDDVVKIGEETLISVKFAAAVHEESQLRRNPRNQVNARVTRGQKKNEELVENLEVKREMVKNEGIVTRTGRGRRKNLQEMPPESGEVQVQGNANVKLEEVESGGDVEGKLRRNPRRQVNARVTRGQKKNEELVENLEVNCEMVKNEGIVTRAGRGRRKNLQEMPPESGEVQVQGNANVKLEEVEFGGDVEGKKSEMKCEEVTDKASKLMRNGQGRRRNLQEIPPESGQVLVVGNENLKSKEVACDGDFEGRDMEMECITMEMASEVMQCKVKRKGRGQRRRLPEMLMESSQVQVDNNENLRSEELAGGRDAEERRNNTNIEDKVEIEVNRDVEESSNKVEDNGENGVNGGVKESGDQLEERVESDVNRDVAENGNTVGDKVGSGVEEKGLDLEKMTLGEWFNYMEVYLPKQIIEATEEMIDGMRRKAERVHDYMIQQKMEKVGVCHQNLPLDSSAAVFSSSVCSFTRRRDRLCSSALVCSSSAEKSLDKLDRPHLLIAILPSATPLFKVIGLNSVTVASDEFEVVDCLDEAREKAEARAESTRNDRIAAKAGDGKITLSSLASAVSAGKLSGIDLHQLNVILKVDVQAAKLAVRWIDSGVSP